ncbi:phosphoglucosamine mutase [Synergistales bacterium]|nr:phosphoglucosamine mutase [Synergistales bacterium]
MKDDNGTAKSVRRLFGTDGVRDIANRGAMTPEFAASLGAAFVKFLKNHGASRPRIVVGKDTRRSCSMLEAALASGMASEGADVKLLGVFPTPGVSFTAKKHGFDGGAVISASHNPAEYNGIKFLDSGGCKLSDADEDEIASHIEAGGADRPTGAGVGVIEPCGDGADYAAWLRKLAAPLRDRGLTLVIDAANGAAHRIAEEVFYDWGGHVFIEGNVPDGLNINAGCGVMHIDNMASSVKLLGADIGIAYDGDADRALLCDSLGRVIDGDVMLWVIGLYLESQGILGAGVAATVMSNMVLEEKLAARGIKTFRCPVGDRYVLEKMKETGAALGGEQSGHIIASNYTSTGDGLCTGILFLTACKKLSLDISSLIDDFPRYPQILRNLKISDQEAVMNSPHVHKAVENAEKSLEGKGRLLLRPSGTEPLIRIFVESRDERLMHSVCDEIEAAVSVYAQK